MATYKVITDIEAEDKLLGPLTFRQFIYALIGSFFLFLTWFVGQKLVFMVPVFLLPAAFAAFLAFPWRRDQPTELWALAKLRFMLKPHKRIWNQSGVKELVTVTAPKKKQLYVSSLSQGEVKSRLHALADTLDSRGWVIKNLNAAPQIALAGAPAGTDRLIEAEAPVVDAAANTEDMLDASNPRTQRMNTLINAATKERREKVIQEMNQSTIPKSTERQNDWFMSQPANQASIPTNQVTFNTQVVAPRGQPQQLSASTPVAAVSSPDEATLVKELDARKQESPMESYYGHLKTIQPVGQQKKQQQRPPEVATKPPTKKEAPPAPSPADVERQAKLQKLAVNDNLNIETIAREAKRDEVVINLH